MSSTIKTRPLQEKKLKAISEIKKQSNPKFDETFRSIVRLCRAKKKGVGIHYSYEIGLETAWANEGANIILHSSDIVLFGETMKRDLDGFRSELDK